jgi:integrase
MGTVYKRNSKGKYYGEYTDPSGKRVRRSTGTTVKSDALAIVAKWEADANAMRHGIRMAKHTTLHDLLLEYIAYLGNSGDQHQELTQQRVTRVLETNEWTKPDQINQLGLETAVRSFANLNTGKPLSMRSQGHYLGAFKSFVKWLVELRQVLPRNPIAAVRKPNFDADRKRQRRYLLHEEWAWLCKSESALLYETAIVTGFRSNELRSIMPSHVHPDHILLPAKYCKNKRQAKQWISPDLSSRLRAHVPFAMPAKEEIARQLYADLAEARAAWEAAGHKSPADFLLPENTLGHVLDFHALRHTCGAWLAIAGVNPKVIQSVMRHSTIVLTLDTYGHLMPGAESTAIDQLSTLVAEHGVGSDLGSRLAVDLCQTPSTY